MGISAKPAPSEGTSMDQEQIRQKIASFPRWHYQFDLAGNLTPIFREKWIGRHQERKRYFVDPVVDLYGGSLEGKRVLDLGCNAGFWSLQAIEAGADFVMGVDGREMHKEQADFVFEVKGVDKSRYQFIVGNVYDVDYKKYGQFDVVFCFGLLYHLAKPMRLFELMSEINKDIFIIDTGIIRMPGSFLKYKQEKMTDPRATMEYELVSSPTKEAVRDMLQTVGYKAVCLKPEFRDWRGSKRYEIGMRRAFIGAKQSDLSRLKATIEPWEQPMRWYHAPAWYGYRVVQALRKANVKGFRSPGT
jgi:2-polyprenyl-3-methyl-5-hydroxy-6-metoxy-1,4-benzoquinol methylase